MALRLFVWMGRAMTYKHPTAINTKVVMEKFDELQEKLREDARDIKAEQDYWRKRDEQDEEHRNGMWSAAQILREQGAAVLRDFLQDAANPHMAIESLCELLEKKERREPNESSKV